MDYFQIEIYEINEPLCLLKIEHLGLSKVGNIFMVSENLFWERRSMKILAPGFQGMDDG